MRPLSSLVSLEDALRMILSVAEPTNRTDESPLGEALDRVVAEDIPSPFDVPLADRSAMDGYAVRAADTVGANAAAPIELRLVGTLYAGRVPEATVGEGTCVEVATGAMVPAGANAVVKVEDTERAGETVRIRVPARAGQHVSRRGADLREGETVVRCGEVLTPARIGALAAIGATTVRVYARPRVTILTTGDEVVPPGEPIRPGQIYDINTHTIASVVREAGGEPVPLGCVADTFEALEQAIRRAAEADVVVCSGGSSVGVKDLIADVLRAAGEIKFHGVAIKPGKPTALGVVAGTPVLGMPGNPTSCLSNGYLMLAPLLRAIGRLPPKVDRTLDLPLDREIASPPGRTEIHTVRVEGGRAIPAYKESGTITSMAHADGYIVIPADVERIAKGEPVRVVLF